MRAINQKAEQIFKILIEGLKDPCDHRKLENNSAYMAVSVECIDITADNQRVFSVAHYYEQNGDLCSDPEMNFLGGIRDFDPDTGDAVYGYYPLTFEMSGSGISRNAAKWEKGKIVGFNPKMQKDHAVFAGTWMNNIKQQQNL